MLRTMDLDNTANFLHNVCSFRKKKKKKGISKHFVHSRKSTGGLRSLKTPSQPCRVLGKPRQAGASSNTHLTRIAARPRPCFCKKPLQTTRRRWHANDSCLELRRASIQKIRIKHAHRAKGKPRSRPVSCGTRKRRASTTTPKQTTQPVADDAACFVKRAGVAKRSSTPKKSAQKKRARSTRARDAPANV